VPRELNLLRPLSELRLKMIALRDESGQRGPGDAIERIT
jgi:hypothetical protein